MSYKYEKDKIKKLILKYVKSDFNDIYNIKSLIELMLSKKKAFKKDDFEGLEDICWKCAKKSVSNTIIEFLSLGQKISQKLQSDKYNWYDEMGKTYEEFAWSRPDSIMVQTYHLNDAVECYQKGHNPQKVEKALIKLKHLQREYKPTKITFTLPGENIIIPIITEIFENVPKNSNQFLEYLVHDNNPFLIPKLEKDTKNHEDFIKEAPILGLSNQLKFDNNFNITQKISTNSNDEEKIKESNHKQYSFNIEFEKEYLRELYIFNYSIRLFTKDNVVNYLSNCQKFLNLKIDNEKTLLYYFKPVIEEYFKQLEIFLLNEETNFVLFIDSIVSKLEFLIRKLCEIYDINMLKPQGDGTTSEKLLHDFFRDPKFKEVLMEKDYDFLKYVLLKPGLNLRNKSAHGFDLDIYTIDNANLLILCFFRLLKYFIIVENDYIQELYFFKWQNFNKLKDIRKFKFEDLKIAEFKIYLLFRLLDNNLNDNI